MEMETGSIQAIAKKLWSLIRVALSMARKGFAKSKLLLDLTLLLSKRTNKLASRVLHSLRSGGVPHPSIYSCKSSNDVILSFIIPNDYEFSCSTTPANNGRLHRLRDEAATMAAVQRVLELIDVGAESPGPRRCCRQLRVTDSPFPAKENEEERVEVNKAADEFIQRFYMDLRLQN